MLFCASLAPCEKASPAAVMNWRRAQVGELTAGLAAHQQDRSGVRYIEEAEPEADALERGGVPPAPW